jgi:hypothetical protein
VGAGSRWGCGGQHPVCPHWAVGLLWDTHTVFLVMGAVGWARNHHGNWALQHRFPEIPMRGTKEAASFPRPGCFFYRTRVSVLSPHLGGDATVNSVNSPNDSGTQHLELNCMCRNEKPH